jgi:hypothetical protein
MALVGSSNFIHQRNASTFLSEGIGYMVILVGPSNFIHQCNALGCECVILKVDLEGDFDTIDHHTILAVL